MTAWQRFDGTNATPASLSHVCANVILRRPIHSRDMAIAHMKYEKAKAPRQSILWHARFLIDEIINFAYYAARGGAEVCKQAFLLLVVFMAAALLDYRASVDFNYSTGLHEWGSELLLCAALSGLGCIVCSAAGLLAYGIGKIRIRGPAEWRYYNWDRYIQQPGVRATIPLRAFTDVDAIRNFLPGAVVSVYVLKQDRVTLDPVQEIACINPVTGEREFAYPNIWDDNGNLLEPH